MPKCRETRRRRLLCVLVRHCVPPVVQTMVLRPHFYHTNPSVVVVLTRIISHFIISVRISRPSHSLVVLNAHSLSVLAEPPGVFHVAFSVVWLTQGRPVTRPLSTSTDVKVHEAIVLQLLKHVGANIEKVDSASLRLP